MRGLIERSFMSGQLLEMIYQDTKGNISQRRIKVLKVSEDKISAYCYLKQQKRTFKISNILSYGPSRNIRRGA